MITETMITEELKQLVREEAEKLRAFAKPKELGRLDFSTFMPSNADRCIYGQMAYNCREPRAVKLLRACAKPYTRHLYIQDRPTDEVEFTVGEMSCFSPIEAYIVHREAKNHNLISYLRGETDILEL